MKEANNEKHLTYRETSVTITWDFLSETMPARREWSETVKMLKDKRPPT